MLVNYKVGRRYKMYVSKLVEMNGKFLEVLCLRRDKKLKKNVFGFCFPKRVDENCVSQDQVLKDLPEPLKEGKNFIFSSDVFDGLTIF